MTGKGHLLSGLAFSPFPAFAAFSVGGVESAVIAIAFTVAGSTAPDWLEIQTPVKKRCPHTGVKKIIGVKTLIPHRGITHTIAIWGLFLIYSLHMMIGVDALSPYIESKSIDVIFASMLLGFSCGGIIHLLGDLPNKQKIPIITPWDGISLNLWKSGKNESFMITLFFCLSLLSIYLIKNFF